MPTRPSHGHYTPAKDPQDESTRHSTGLHRATHKHPTIWAGGTERGHHGFSILVGTLPLQVEPICLLGAGVVETHTAVCHCPPAAGSSLAEER